MASLRSSLCKHGFMTLDGDAIGLSRFDLNRRGKALHAPGVAEPGGGGQGGHGPPKNLSGRARVSFGPPKF